MINEDKIVCDIIINKTTDESSNLQNRLACGEYIKYQNVSIFPDEYEIISNKNNILSILFYSDGIMVNSIDTEYSLCFESDEDEFGRKFIKMYEVINKTR